MATITLFVERSQATVGDKSASLALTELDNLLVAHDEAADTAGTGGHAAAAERVRATEDALLARTKADPEAAALGAGLAVAALARLRREADETFAKLQATFAAFDALAERHALDRENAVADALRSYGIEPSRDHLPNF